MDDTPKCNCAYPKGPHANGCATRCGKVFRAARGNRRCLVPLPHDGQCVEYLGVVELSSEPVRGTDYDKLLTASLAKQGIELTPLAEITPRPSQEPASDTPKFCKRCLEYHAPADPCSPDRRPSQEPASVAQGGASPGPPDHIHHCVEPTWEGRFCASRGWCLCKCGAIKPTGRETWETTDFGGSQESTTPPDIETLILKLVEAANEQGRPGGEQAFRKATVRRDAAHEALASAFASLVAENTRLESERRLWQEAAAKWERTAVEHRSTVTRQSEELEEGRGLAIEAANALARQSEVIGAGWEVWKCFDGTGDLQFSEKASLMKLYKALASLTPPTPQDETK